MNNSLRVIIQSPIAKVWEGDVLTLSAENSEGVFDILPDHARFMSLLNASAVSLELLNADTKSFTFQNALLYVAEDIATIYVQESLEKISNQL
jgi:F0F1-type ATP synthase epsilon subunit